MAHSAKQSPDKLELTETVDGAGPDAPRSEAATAILKHINKTYGAHTGTPSIILLYDTGHHLHYRVNYHTRNSADYRTRSITASYHVARSSTNPANISSTGHRFPQGN